MVKYLHAAAAVILTCVCSITWAGKVANKPPTVSLTAPLNGATFVPPANITLSANASDSDGTVAKVGFYQGTNLIGTAMSAPYSVTWSNVQAGSYTLTAKATDNAGASTTSSAVSITVGTPKLAITSPANGATVYGDQVTVTGTVVDEANPTVWVDNGGMTRQAQLAYSTSGKTFSATLPLYLGTNTLNVSLARRDKVSDSASVTISGSNYPQIVIKSPTNATFDAPANITLAVDAISPSGSISKVNFLNGATLLSSVTAAPYQYIWSNVEAGSYPVSVQAVDNLGYMASVSIPINVAGPNTLPVVSMTSPTNGAVFSSPANITLAANTTDPDGSITKVEFLLNGDLYSATNVAPYTSYWGNVGVGSYTLLARATDNRNGVTTSAPVKITVTPPNNPPTVSLTSPVSGASFSAAATIILAANAADSDGTIEKVEFFQGSTLIGIVTSAPYTLNWPNVPSGSYTITAKATDNLGAATTSTPASITVNANQNPTVSLTSPAAGTTFISPAEIGLSANAADSDGSISQVEFFQGTTLIGSAISAPYTFSWTNVSEGNYTITAKATDNLGGTSTSAPVNVVVNANTPPIVTLTSPSSGLNLFAPASITLQANASDNDGSIAKVEFFEGNTLIGTATDAPYAFTWTNVAVGNYTLTARATDNLGGVAVSAAVTAAVNGPSVAFTSPADGVTLSGDKVLVQGTFQGPSNSGVTVNGVVAALDASNHFYANVPIVAGANTITATLTTPSGQTATQSITATGDGIAHAVRIDADRIEGIGPLTVNFSIQGAGPITAAFNVSGGTVSVVQNGNIIAATYATAGTYPTTVTVTDGEGNTTVADYVIVVQDAAVMDQKFKSLWNGMNDAVIAGNKATALNYLSLTAQVKYGPVFDALQADYQQIVSTWSPPMRGDISTDIGEYAVVTNNAGTRRLFLIYFVRGTDGVWRLESM